MTNTDNYCEMPLGYTALVGVVVPIAALYFGFKVGHKKKIKKGK